MAFKCFPLDGFNRDPVLNPAEKAAIIPWQESHHFPYKDKESLNGPLLRLAAPVLAALKHADYLDEVKQRRVISLIFLAMGRTQTTYWSWTSAEWNSLIDSASLASTHLEHPPHRSISRPLLTCACLLHGPEILLNSRRITHFQDLAGTILGRDGIQESVRSMQEEGVRLGISANTKGYMPAYLSEALLLCGSPRLSDLTIDVFVTLKDKYRTGSKLMRRTHQPVTRILHNLKVLPYPLIREFTKCEFLGGVNDDLYPEWLSWINRWFETSTMDLKTRQAHRNHLAKLGRWFAATYPGSTSPEQWTRDTAAAFVAAVSSMHIGDWSHPQSRVKREPRKPLKPRSKCMLLAVARCFFFDCQYWEWLPYKFDPSNLETPRSISCLVGPAPRVIADLHWAKLLNAGVGMTKKDVPTFLIRAKAGDQSNAATYYPFEMVKALAIIWLFSGLRANEIQRLRVGCARKQSPVEDGFYPQQDKKKPVCMLDVPISKKANAQSKPVDPLLGAAISAWERIRPATAQQCDAKTGDMVDFLFVWRGKQVSVTYINRTIIPLLCQLAGTPTSDARGAISSHRARATIASQLYNAPGGFDIRDLQHWLGHRTPQATMSYVSPSVTKLSKAYTDADFFARNVRMIDVLVDPEGIHSGAATAGQPWLLYDVGHGFCSNVVYDKCAHRMACARCDFYLPKESSYVQMLEAKQNIIHMRQALALQPEEIAAMDGDEEYLNKLIAKLEHTPTPQGPTPAQLRASDSKT